MDQVAVVNRIMQPYRPTRRGRFGQFTTLALLALWGIATGAGVALLPPELLWILGVPVAVLVGIILWILPDNARVPERLLATLFVILIAANALWPNYIAINVRGLPWINPPRIAAFAVLAVGIYAYATSLRMRSEVAAALASTPLINWTFWVFIAAMTLSIVFSDSPVGSLTKWVNNQIYWTGALMVSIWLALRPGFISRIVAVWIVASILMAIVAIYEFHIQQLPWLGHIPSFLQIDADFMEIILGAQTRNGTSEYRTHGVFTVALVLAEYLSLLIPFVIHSIIKEQRFPQRLMLVAGFFALVTAIYCTGTRSGIFGLLIGMFSYAGLLLYRNWRRQHLSLIAVTSLVALPALVFVVLSLSLASNTLKQLTFGGSQHQSSSDARDEQWSKAVPLVAAAPAGYGPGKAAETLDFHSPGGLLTIDSYYLNLLLEFGVVGFAGFFVLFAGQFFYGAKAYFHAEGEEDFVGPATTSLVTYLIVSSVLSDEKNMFITFMLLGFVIAIVQRQRQRLGARTIADTSALDAPPFRRPTSRSLRPVRV